MPHNSTFLLYHTANTSDVYLGFHVGVVCNLDVVTQLRNAHVQLIFVSLKSFTSCGKTLIAASKHSAATQHADPCGEGSPDSLMGCKVNCYPGLQ